MNITRMQRSTRVRLIFIIIVQGVKDGRRFTITFIVITRMPHAPPIFQRFSVRIQTSTSAPVCVRVNHGAGTLFMPRVRSVWAIVVRTTTPLFNRVTPENIGRRQPRCLSYPHCPQCHILCGERQMLPNASGALLCRGRCTGVVP